MWHAAQRKKTLFKSTDITFQSAICVLLQTQHIIAQNFLRVLQSPPPIFFTPKLQTQHFIHLPLPQNLKK